MLEVDLLNFGRLGALVRDGKILATWPVNSVPMEAPMPKTAKGKKIMKAMKRTYGSEKGEEVFYKSRNKGTIKGVDRKRRRK